jgi:cbb3-type cytochrome oxidase maturation protein
MSALFLLIGISLAVAVCFLIAFLIAVKKGQYDDDYTPSVRILFENETKQNESNKINDK